MFIRRITSDKVDFEEVARVSSLLGLEPEVALKSAISRAEFTGNSVAAILLYQMRRRVELSRREFELPPMKKSVSVALLLVKSATGELVAEDVAEHALSLGVEPRSFLDELVRNARMTERFYRHHVSNALSARVHNSSVMALERLNDMRAHELMKRNRLLGLALKVSQGKMSLHGINSFARARNIDPLRLPEMLAKAAEIKKRWPVADSVKSRLLKKKRF